MDCFPSVVFPPAASINAAIGATSYKSLNLGGDYSVANVENIPSDFMKI